MEAAKKVSALIAGCGGKPYADPAFTGRKALGRDFGEAATWRRMRDFSPSPILVDAGGAKPNGSQGALGDCYLLSALSVLASHSPAYVDNLLITRTLNEAGVLCARFWRGGRWREVIIDDTLPARANAYFDGKDPDTVWSGAPDPSRGRYAVQVMAKSKNRREFWMPLLEKAYGRLNGSMAAIEGGFVHSALVDMVPNSSGALLSLKEPAVQADLRSGALWARLLEYHGNGYMLGAGSPGGSDTEVSSQGIVQGHAYAILRVAEESDAKGTYQLLQLLNPWASGAEWNGPFSDSDKVRWTRRLKQRLGYEPDAGGEKTDGLFWMQLSDFAAAFEDIYVCRLFKTVAEGGPWYKYTARGEWRGRTAGGCPNYADTCEFNPQFYVKPSRPCSLYISLSQVMDAAGSDVNIGFKLLRKEGKRAKAVYAGQSLIAAPYTALSEAAAEGKVVPSANPYTLFVSTFEPRLARSFVVSVYADAPLEMTDGEALRLIPETVPAA